MKKIFSFIKNIRYRYVHNKFMKLILKFDDSNSSKLKKKLHKLSKYKRFDPNYKNGLFLYNSITLNGNYDLIKYLLGKYTFYNTIRFKESIQFLIKYDNDYLFKLFINNYHDKYILVLCGTDRNLFDDIIGNNSMKIYNDFLNIGSYNLKFINVYIIKSIVKYNRIDLLYDLYDRMKIGYCDICDIDDNKVINSCIKYDNDDFFRTYLDSGLFRYNEDILIDKSLKLIMDNKIVFFKIIIDKIINNYKDNCDNLLTQLIKYTIDYGLYDLSKYLINNININNVNKDFKDNLIHVINMELNFIIFNRKYINKENKKFINLILEYGFLHNNIDVRFLNKIKPNYKPKNIIRNID